MKYLIFIMFISNLMSSQNLNKHQWNDRVIVITADEANREMAEEQFATLMKDKEKLIERKIVLYKCVEEKCTLYNLKDNPTRFQEIETSKGFKIVLIGLDGGEKYSSKSTVKTNVLLNLIDAMPMRRQELKSTNKND